MFTQFGYEVNLHFMEVFFFIFASVTVDIVTGIIYRIEHGIYMNQMIQELHCLWMFAKSGFRFLVHETFAVFMMK